MPSFALITEGITDQAVIENIIIGYYNSKLDTEVDIRPLQPPRDATDEARAGGFGGWERILEHCTYEDRLLEAIALSDYLIIQIDTDCSDHVNFGVLKTCEGIDRKVGEIISDVRSLLIRKLDSVYESHSS